MSSGIDRGHDRVNGKMVYDKIQRNEKPLGKQNRNNFIRIKNYHRQTPDRALFDVDFGSHIQMGLAEEPIVAQNVAWWRRVFVFSHSSSLAPSKRHQVRRKVALHQLDLWNNHR